MSSGEQANQQPPALENFLIVAYRSLRGNKRVSAFGCPKDLLDASALKIYDMSQHSCFVRKYVVPSDFTKGTNQIAHKHNRYLLFKTKSRIYDIRKLKMETAGIDLPKGQLTKKGICASYFVHAGGFSGLTVIIHDCYVVILTNMQPRVLRYYKDEEGQIKCETTAIPVKPQQNYYGDWSSNNRSFAHHYKQVAYITVEGQLAVFSMDRPADVTLWSPSVSNQIVQPTVYVDVKLHDHNKFGLFAVTACGRIDYYQGAKRLVHSHTIDLYATGKVGPQDCATFTTICCDDKYLGVAFIVQGLPTKNGVAVLRIKGSGSVYSGLNRAVATIYSVEKASIAIHNPAHHLAFMYPKRYRILYAQQLFNLGCLFYVGRKYPTIIPICTSNLHTCCSKDSFIMTTDKGKLLKVRICLDGRSQQSEMDALKQNDCSDQTPLPAFNNLDLPGFVNPNKPPPVPNNEPLVGQNNPNNHRQTESSLDRSDPQSGADRSPLQERIQDMEAQRIWHEWNEDRWDLDT